MIAAEEITGKLRRIVQHNGYGLVMIEMPSVYGGSGAAARDSNAITKLAYTVGMISGMLNYAPDCCPNVQTVDVIRWKGNLPKQLTTTRVNRKYGLELNWRTKQHNVADAIAIGDWYFSSPSTYKKKNPGS